MPSPMASTSSDPSVDVCERRRWHPAAVVAAIIVVALGLRTAAPSPPSHDEADKDIESEGGIPVAFVGESEYLEVGESGSYETGESLNDAARSVLERYRQEEGASLVESGYLDLLGKVWSCTVKGQGWVDTCIVREGEGAASCTVCVISMNQEEWEESYEQDLP